MDQIDPTMIALADTVFGYMRLLTIFAFVLAIVWISRHYKWRRHRGMELNEEDRAVLAELGQLAGRIETRVATLERILDADDPKWRDRAA